MSYDAIVQGLEERLRAVEGINQVLDHEPTSIESVSIVSVLDSFNREQSRGQVTTMVYRTIHTLVLRWQDNAQAERELRPFINRVCAAIDADPSLGGRCATAKIVSGSAGFADISGVRYRIVDFISEVTEKKPFQSGI